jgi:uncharacterized protein (DUF1330 family)
MVAFMGLIKSLDQQALTDYLSKVGQTVELFGGSIAARGKTLTPIWNELNCESFDAYVEVCFDSVERGTEWANSPQYQNLLPVRNKAMQVTFFGLEPRN